MSSSSSSSRIANTTFLHFNDVYNIEKAPCFITSLTNVRNAKLQSKVLLPVGKTNEGNNTSSSSICRVVRRHHSKVITLFSGDAFSPSMMSTVLKGKQMIPVLNACNIDVACLGENIREETVM
jgi:2',3'-cyclic-nucleotide 2'-phosphodiesterase (5'-nucleotidase family)